MGSFAYDFFADLKSTDFKKNTKNE